MIIGLTGTLAAGKGTISEIFLKKGFQHYSVRYFLIKELEKRSLPIDRDNMVLIANELRKKYSAGHIVEKLYEMAQETGGNCVIESIRTVGEVEALKEKKEFVLIAIDADSKLRYERAIKRSSSTDKISYEKFVEQEQKEMESYDKTEQNIAKCIELADFKIENNSSIEKLKKEVEEILEKIEKNKSAKTKKREDYINWDEYFMGVSLLSSKRSKDPNTQVGACIVNEEKKIVGTGYNGFPKGCSDDEFPWSREGNYLETKYPYVAHAELNAILNSTGRNLDGCTIYVALFPCNECAKAIIQAGIKKVVYLSDKYFNEKFTLAAKKMFDSSGVKYEKLIPKNKEILLNFKIEY